MSEVSRLFEARLEALSAAWAERTQIPARDLIPAVQRLRSDFEHSLQGLTSETESRQHDLTLDPEAYVVLGELVFQTIEAAGVLLSGAEARALSTALLAASARSTRRLRDTVLAAAAGEWSLDLPSDRISGDARAIELLGLTATDAPSRAALFDHLPFASDRATLERAIEDALSGRNEGVCSAEFRGGGKGGSPLRWLECRARVSYDRAGRPLRLCGLVMDVSARKAREEQARAKTAWLTLLLDNIKDYAVILSDMDRMVVEWQGGAATITGYSAAEVVGQSTDILFTTTDRLAAVPEKEMATALRDGRAEDKRWHVRKDNSRFFADGVMTPLYDAEGNLNGFGKVFRDATEQKRAEEALRLSDERLHFALRAGRMGTWDLDVATNELTVSETCKANYGRGPSEPFGYADLVASVYEEDRALWQRKLDGAIADCSDLDLEYRVRWPDASIHWVHVRASCTEESGRATALSGVCTSIDERKAIEEELRTADRRKDEFLSTASHELRTPLNAILGWASMLRSGRLDPEAARRAAETIERNARAQVQLIEDILDGSRIITGKLRLEIRPLDMTELVGAAIDAIRPAAEAKNIRLSVCIDPLAARVAGDPDRLQQVVWNLGTNAIKFTPRGGAVEVRLQRSESSIELSVKDTGQGIATEFLPHVFERFRQADGSTTRRHGGLGLGLALVRHLVDAHGGTVRAESEGEGRGSTFVVQLPVQAVHAAASASARPPALRDAELDLSGVTALVVDDEADARDLVAAVLRLNGAEVRTAATAESALAELARTQPAILLSDVGMPQTDGYTFIRQVRERIASDQTLPAIALTAYAREEDRRLALSAGFQIHVAKPVDPTELVRAVAHLVRHAQKQPRAE